MNLQYRLAQIIIRIGGCLIFRWQVVGRENIPNGAALIASNHLSNYDPPLIGGAINRKMHYFAKVELFKNKLIGAFLKSVLAFPVKRGEADKEAWKYSRKLLADKKLLLFFPEGTRSLSGELQEAKPGLARLAVAAQVPVIPTVLINSHRLKDVLWGKVKLKVGFAKPIEPESLSSGFTKREICDNLTQKVMREISKLKSELEKK